MKQFIAILCILIIGFILYNGIKIEEIDSEGNLINNEIISENEIKPTVEDILVGEGDEVINGDSVSVHYIGTLLDGTKFDSSKDSGTPLDFTVGSGSLIQGFEEGVIGMKVGGIRKITIPPEIGYGDIEKQNIPANSTLVFEVELLEIIK